MAQTTDGEQVPVYSGELYATFVNNICGHVIGNENNLLFDSKILKQPLTCSKRASPCTKSNTYSCLKCFIALQNFMPVVQGLHPFTIPARRTRNDWVAISHTGFLRRICPMANMCRQRSGDGNLIEHRRRADHDDGRDDLRRTNSPKRKGSTN